MCKRNPISLALALVTLVFAASVVHAGEVVIFSEDFENPMVDGYVEGSVPDAGWIGSTEGYGAKWRGLISEGDGAVFATPFGEQGYRLRYTNSGLTTEQGAIGAVLQDAIYTLTFNVAVCENAYAEYLVELVAFEPAEGNAVRTECRAERPGTVVAAAEGNVTTKDMSENVSLVFTVSSEDVSLGKDLAIRLIKRKNSAIYDNVKLTVSISRVAAMLPVAAGNGGGVDYDFFIGRSEASVDAYADFLNSAEMAGEISVIEGEVRNTASDLYCHTAQSQPASPIVYNPEAVTGERFASVEGKEKHPMVFVSWFGAAAYCNWRSAEAGLTAVYDPSAGWAADMAAGGFRLPTEDEWYKAAAWNADTGSYLTYGTGKNIISAEDANYLDSGDASESEAVRTTPVAAFLVESFYGLRDASGNVWEWCHGFLSDSGSIPATDAHSVRGGSWGNLKEDVSTDSRCGFKPAMAVSTVGFRVVTRTGQE